jgi:putative sugar O-methyltransferase
MKEPSPAPPSLDRLARAYERCAGQRERLESAGLLAGADDVSDFWREYLDSHERRNYPTFNEMLVMRRGATYPMAERAAEELHEEAERVHAEAAYQVASRSLPPGFMKRLEESPVGAPIAFSFAEGTFTANALTNAITASRVVEWCGRCLPSRRLRILEIGAGFGQMADQLLRLLDVESYTICDLPENLFLSAFFLQASHPSRTATLVTGLEDAPSELNFLTPPLLKWASGPYDLVVNAYSFQEMNRSSVETYFVHTRRTLAADGFLYSLNSHAKSGIRAAREYPLAGFRLLGMTAPRAFPFQLTATEPYELVLTPGEGAPVDEIDAVAQAYQVGLHQQIEGVAASLVGGSEGRYAPWLEALTVFLSPADAPAKERALARLEATGALPAPTGYLRACLSLACGRWQDAEREMLDVVDLLDESPARARAHTSLAALAHRRGDHATRRAQVQAAARFAPHLARDVEVLSVDYHALSGQDAGWLRLTGRKRSGRRQAAGGLKARLLRASTGRHGRDAEANDAREEDTR